MEWKTYRIGEIGKMFVGGDKPSIFSDTKTAICSIPVFSNGIERQGLYGYTDTARIYDKCITISARGTVGAVFYRDEPFLPIVRLIAYIPNPSIVDCKYLYYLLQLSHLEGFGTSQQQITVPYLSKIKLSINSSLPIQRRIASILSSYDNLIETNNRRIKLLEQMAENIYKEWFVRFRFPGHENCKMVDGLPEGWKIETVDSFCKVFTGKKDVNQTIVDGQYPFFSCSAQDFRSNDYIYDGKAILVAGNGNTGKSKFYDGKFDLYQRTYAVVCEDDFIYYLYWRFKTDFEKIYAGGSRGTAIPYIVLKNITKYKFVYHKETIDTFVKIAKPIQEQIFILQTQNANLARQRDMLLPRLMSGKIELK